MTRERVLVDTGPLVAILSASDQYHAICVEQSRQLRYPLLTCWPVLTEAVWLLRQRLDNVQRLFDLLENDLLQCLELDPAASGWIASFFARYADREPQLADAALMYLAERERVTTIFTIDRRDFLVYRFSDKRRPAILPSLEITT